MTAASPAVIGIGSLWKLRSGAHAGQQVVVLRVTAINVVYRETIVAGASQGRGKVDPSREHVMHRDVFLRRYVPATNGAPGNGLGAAFRQANSPKPKPEEPKAQYKPLEGVIDTKATPGLNVESIEVTPAQAAAWLERGGKNRKLSERRVEALAAAIRRGEWRITGETIKLDADGCVRDGQHRLAAIARAGMPVKTLVVRGVGEDAFDVIDTGRARTIGDIVGLHGYASSLGMAAAVRNLINIEMFGTPNPGERDARAVISAPTTLHYLAVHPDVPDGVRIGDRLRQAGLQGGIGLWGALFTLFLRKSPEQAAQFANLLQSGANLTARHPALVLRNRAMNTSLGWSRSASAREMLAAIAVKAWNAYRNGRPIDYLAYRTGGNKPESFPEVN